MTQEHWKQIKPHLWERCDGYTASDQGARGWWVGQPNGLIVRGATNKILRFACKHDAVSFVDLHYHVRKNAS